MRRYLPLLLITVLLAYGCKKDDDPITPERERTYLHILGAVEADTFNLTFDYYNADDVVISDFHYKRNFPIAGYADMLAGGVPDADGVGKLFLTVSRQPFVNVAPDTLMQPKEIVLNPDEQATMCLVDSFGTATMVKYVDNYQFTTSGVCLVRLINLDYRSATAGITSANGQVNISGIPFLEASSFMPLDFGQNTIELRDTAGAVTTSVNAWLTAGVAYTFYVSGNNANLDYFAH